MEKNRQILHLISYIILVYCVLLEPWEVGGERHQNHHPDKALSSSSLAVGNWQATRWDQRIIIHQHQHWSWSSMLILESCQYQSCRSSKINTLGCQSRFKNKWFSQETLGAPKAVRRRTTFPMLPLPVAMAPAVYPQTCGSKDTWSFWNPINLKNLAFLIVLNFLKWITPRMILHAPWCYKKKDGIGRSGFAVVMWVAMNVICHSQNSQALSFYIYSVISFVYITPKNQTMEKMPACRKSASCD